MLPQQHKKEITAIPAIVTSQHVSEVQDGADPIAYIALLSLPQFGQPAFFLASSQLSVVWWPELWNTPFWPAFSCLHGFGSVEL